MSERLVRTESSRAWTHRDAFTVLARDGRALRFEGPSADLARAVYEHLALPRTRADVLAHVTALAGELRDPSPLVDPLLAGLIELRAVAPHRSSPRRDEPVRRVVLALSGAIAAAHAPMLVSRLHERRWEVRVIATANALRFVTREALEAISAHALGDSLWRRDDRTRALHIELATWAELVLVCPASATTIARLATGDGDDLVGATALATAAPVLVVPSMNPQMFASPAVQRNLAQLRDDGRYVLEPAAGVEVADAPMERAPAVGPAPSHDDVVAVAAAVLAAHPSPAAPQSADGWNALYAAHPASARPWHRASPEPELAAVLDALARPGLRALDVGAGTGLVARYLATLGCTVTALDSASRAVDEGRAAGSPPLHWVVGDVTDGTLEGPFDLVVDRACLHTLPQRQRAAWVATMRRVCAPGATVVVVAHDRDDGARAGTQGFDRDELIALLADVGTVRVAATTLAGDGGVVRRAWRAIAHVAEP